MKWRNANQAHAILKLVSESRTVNEDGSIAYNHFRAKYRWESVIFTATVDREISDTLRAAAVAHAIKAHQDLTPENFKAAYKAYLRKIEGDGKRYLLAFPIWGNAKLLERSLTIDSIKIEINPDVESRTFAKVHETRELQREESSSLFPGPLDYLRKLPLVFCRLSATSPQEAFELGSKALYEYLGAITFWDNYGRWAMELGSRQPLNRILVAPQISVHTSTGKLAYPGFWYDDWYPKSGISSSERPERLDRVWKGANRFLHRVQMLPWRQKGKRALRMYFEAFSEHDSEAAFLSAWRILELIGGDGQTRADLLVERAAKCFEDYLPAQLIGHHLRERRNTVTHFGAPHAYDGGEVVQEMKDFIWPLLRIYTTNPFSFQSESEFWEFLDVSPDLGRRRRLGYILSKADKFHRNRD